MHCVLRFVALVATLSATCFGAPPAYKPTNVEVQEHRAEVYRLARDFVVKTFNVVPTEEGKFNPVRFNSTGIWGDFECRIKELGDDRFEVQGWLITKGHFLDDRTSWSVVIRHPLKNPEAWRYRRVDEVEEDPTEVTSWRYGRFRSVPYLAEYSKEPSKGKEMVTN